MFCAAACGSQGLPALCNDIRGHVIHRGRAAGPPPLGRAPTAAAACCQPPGAPPHRRWHLPLSPRRPRASGVGPRTASGWRGSGWRSRCSMHSATAKQRRAPCCRFAALRAAADCEECNAWHGRPQLHPPVLPHHLDRLPACPCCRSVRCGRCGSRASPQAAGSTG